MILWFLALLGLAVLGAGLEIVERRAEDRTSQRERAAADRRLRREIERH